jgi:hypothetical protein
MEWANLTEVVGGVLPLEFFWHPRWVFDYMLLALL